MSSHSASANAKAAFIRADEKAERADVRIITAQYPSVNKTQQTVQRAPQTMGAWAADDDIAHVLRPVNISKTKIPTSWKPTS